MDTEKRPALLTTNFALLCLMSLSAFSSFYFLLATLPMYILARGRSESQLGLIIGVFSAMAVLIRLPVGRAVDRHGKTPFILLGAILLTISSGLYILVDSVRAFLLVRILHGAAWALFGTALSALVADVIPQSRRGEGMGYYGMFSNLAMATGPALGIVLKDQGYQLLFTCSSALALVAGLLLIFLQKGQLPVNIPASADHPQKSGHSTFLDRTAVFPSFILGLIAITYGSIVSFLPIHAINQGIRNPGIFFTVYACTLIIARSFTGKLSDRYGRTSVIIPGIVLAALALAVLSHALSMSSFLLAAFLYGMGFAALQPAILALVVDRADPSRRGVAMGTTSVAMDAGIGGGSFIWGIVAQRGGYSVLYLCSAAVALLAVVIFVSVHRTEISTEHVSSDQ